MSLSKDFINAIANIVCQYSIDRKADFAIVKDLSFFMGRLEQACDIAWERNLLTLFEEEYSETHKKLQKYCDTHTSDILRVFPALKQPLKDYLKDNPFTVLDDRYIVFDDARRNVFNRWLNIVLEFK